MLPFSFGSTYLIRYGTSLIANCTYHSNITDLVIFLNTFEKSEWYLWCLAPKPKASQNVFVLQAYLIHHRRRYEGKFPLPPLRWKGATWESRGWAWPTLTDCPIDLSSTLLLRQGQFGTYLYVLRLYLTMHKYQLHKVSMQVRHIHICIWIWIPLLGVHTCKVNILHILVRWPWK